MPLRKQPKFRPAPRPPEPKVPVWKDETSYSHGERGKKAPTAWICSWEGIRLSVHRLHRCEGWYTTAFPFYNARPLKSPKIGEAVIEATEVLFSFIKGARKAVDAIERASLAGIVEAHAKFKESDDA